MLISLNLSGRYRTKDFWFFFQENDDGFHKICFPIAIFGIMVVIVDQYHKHTWFSEASEPVWLARCDLKITKKPKNSIVKSSGSL